MREVLITGGSGQVGSALTRLSWPDDVRVHAPGRDELDLSDPASVRRVTESRPWAAILSCGAYTAVDKAETEIEVAWTVNALAPAILAGCAARTGAPIVHVSTDYVFGGDADGYYAEDHRVAPLNVYGASKEGGEQAVRTAAARHAIVRTAWVVSPTRANFLRTMLRLAGDRDEVRVVGDQRGCPTFAADLARALQTVALGLLGDPDAPTGTFHFVNGGEASWAEFATAIFESSARRGGPSARVVPISTAEYPTPARRPANSRLAVDRLRHGFGVQPRSWQEALEDAMGEALAAG